MNGQTFEGNGSTKKKPKLATAEKALLSFIQFPNASEVHQTMGRYILPGDFTSDTSNDDGTHFGNFGKYTNTKTNSDHINGDISSCYHSSDNINHDMTPCYNTGHSTNFIRLPLNHIDIRNTVGCEPIKLADYRCHCGTFYNKVTAMSDGHDGSGTATYRRSPEHHTTDRSMPPTLSGGRNPMMLLNEIRPGLEYELVSDSGESHSKEFTMAVTVDGQTVMAVGHTKKLAKTRAACAALQWIITGNIPSGSSGRYRSA